MPPTPPPDWDAFWIVMILALVLVVICAEVDRAARRRARRRDVRPARYPRTCYALGCLATATRLAHDRRELRYVWACRPCLDEGVRLGTLAPTERPVAS